MSGSAKSSIRLWVMLLAGLILAVFVGANAHFFYVAFESQPACVDHVKLGSAAADRLSAADSSC